MVESVAAVASAPPATELAARSSCLIIAPSSSSSSSRISLAESLSEVLQASATIVGVTACGSTANAAGSGRRFRNKPNAMSRSREHKMRPASSHLGMKSWLTIALYSGRGHYQHTENPGKSLILAGRRPITPRFPSDTSRTNSERDRMAGHSQFKNIMHRKGRQDAQKSKLFSKLAREITVAAKMGQPDPAMNARLRAAIISARQENMSKDSIERAVKKASGTESENYDEIRYEGYGPGGVAVIVEALTDNRNRAASDIRSYFTKAGADDVSSSESGHEIYASPETFREVARALEAKFGEARKAALTWKPHNTVPVDDETGEKLLKLIDLLNEHDDVQNVYANFEISDALVARMGG